MVRQEKIRQIVSPRYLCARPRGIALSPVHLRTRCSASSSPSVGCLQAGVPARICLARRTYVVTRGKSLLEYCVLSMIWPCITLRVVFLIEFGCVCDTKALPTSPIYPFGLLRQSVSRLKVSAFTHYIYLVQALWFR